MNRREFIRLSRLWLATDVLRRTAAQATEPSENSHSVPFLPGLGPIDAHAHVFTPTPAFYEMLNRLDLRIVNISVIDRHTHGLDQLELQEKLALEVFRGSQGRAVWCSTFDPFRWESPGFVEETIKLLDQTFKNGAIAVKIWKNIGMEIKSKSGKYLLPGDPIFDPILDFLGTQSKTLYAHVAEPPAAWYPPDPSSVEYPYYAKHPEWQMYRYPDRPSRRTLLAARDRILKRHPKLRVVGCHLGSMEEDVDLIAERFDLYPNFAVDVAARVPYLMFQPREKVRAFLVKYQDRVLYGTDADISSTDQPDEKLRVWQERLAHDWRFFATDETFDGELHYLELEVRGLALPAAVLRKIYHENALRWVPGIISSK